MDYLNDSSLQKLHGLSKQYLNDGLPDFVKAADIPNERPADESQLAVYGDTVRRQFPCHTKVATYLSCLYFWGQKYNGDDWSSPYPRSKTAGRLEKAARFWGVLPEVQKFRSTMKKSSSAPNRSLTSADYALAVNYGTEQVCRFPIVNAETVKKAAANLHRYRVSYPYVWRKEAATRILKKAMEFNAVIEPEDLDYIVKASGAYPADPQSIADKLGVRALMFDDEVRIPMRKAAATVMTPGTKPDFEKLCELLDSIDRKYKKYGMYNNGMPTPEEVCYTGATEKLASVPDVIQLTTGSTYDLESIKQAGLEPFSVLDAAYMTEFAANDKGDLDMDKIAAILPTLPRDDAQLLEKAFNALGMARTEKSAARNMSDFTEEGMASVLGDDICKDFSGLVKMRHGQGLHDELKRKQKQDGTGPHGRGAGPGSGKADGSGLPDAKDKQE